MIITHRNAEYNFIRYPSQYVWFTEDEFLYDGDFDTKYDDLSKITIFTSSWQMMALSGRLGGSKTHGIIQPHHEPVPVAKLQKRLPDSLELAWAGSSKDPTPQLIMATLLQLGIPNWKLNLLYTSADGFLPNTRKMIAEVGESRITVYRAKQGRNKGFEEALLSCHAYVNPTMVPMSFDIWASRAMSSGCIPILPRAYGFPEQFGQMIPAFQHSWDNYKYSASFGDELVGAVAMLRGEMGETLIKGLKTRTDALLGGSERVEQQLKQIVDLHLL
jgi:hypothetical protein